MKPTIVQRARAAINVFRHGYPQVKAGPIAWPAYRSGVPQWQMYDYNTFVAEGWTINSLIYSAIAYKMRASSSAPIRAWTGDKEHKEQLGPDDTLSKLLERPNSHQSFDEFQQQGTVYLNLSGNNFTVLMRERGTKAVQEMINLRPDRVRIVPFTDKGRIQVGYLYVPEGKTRADGVPILAEDMMHTKLANPGDPLEGMGYGFPPIAPLARNADVDNSVTNFLKRLFDRGLMPNTYVKYNVPLTPEHVSRVRARYAEAYGGSEEGWLRPVVLGDEGEINTLGYQFDDLGFDGIDERNETRILGPFGVPPILIGSRVGLARATYANYKEARSAFWQDTFVPELRLFEAEYQYYLNEPDRKVWVEFDLSQVPALKEAMIELIGAAHQLWTMGVPSNQATQAVGLTIGDIPGGDVAYIPLSLVPVGSRETAIQQEEPADVTATDDDREEMSRAKGLPEMLAGDLPEPKQLPTGRRLTEPQKDILWKQIDGIAVSWEERYQEAVERAMRKDLRALLAMANEAKKKALELKQSINWTQIALDWDAYWRDQAPKNWRDEFFAVLRGTMTDTAEELNAEFGFSFDVDTIAAQEWFRQYALTFAQEPLQTTADNMKLLIEQGQAEGWTIDELRRQLDVTFERYLDPDFDIDGTRLTDQEKQWFIDRSPRYRKEAIARTETIRASNAGAMETYKAWGVVEMKEWLDSKDNRVRDCHKTGGGKFLAGGTPSIVPVDEPFIVCGEPMMYPTDGSMGASAENIVNCRCVPSPVIMEGLE